MRRRRRRHHRRAVGLRGRPARRRRHLRLVRRPPRCRRRTPPRRPRAGISVHELLTELAATQAVGEHGLVALDWHSGNRSVLVDHELSGLIVGQTLATRPEDIYRALLEATAFGTRMIIETFQRGRRPGHRAHRRRRPAQERAADADLRRRARPAAVDHRLASRARRSARRSTPRSPPAPTPTWPRPPRAMGRVNRGVLPARSGQRARPTTSCTPSTARCTTTSAAAATTSCSACRRSAARRCAEPS